MNLKSSTPTRGKAAHKETTMKTRSSTSIFATALTSFFAFAFIVSSAFGATLISEDFETSSGSTPPTGWSLYLNEASGGTYATGTGSDGTGGSSGNGAQLAVDTRAWNTSPAPNGPKAYLLSSGKPVINVLQDFSGSYDFNMTGSGSYDSAGVFFGDLSTGTSWDAANQFFGTYHSRNNFGNSPAKIVNGIYGSEASDPDGKKTFQGTWYRTTFDWTASTGTFSYTTKQWGGSSWDDYYTVSKAGLSFGGMQGYVGLFDARATSTTFDNFNLDGTEYVEHIWDGGAGSWDTTNNEWDTSSYTWNNTNDASSVAVFGGTGGAVTLDTDIVAGAIIFDATGYSIAPTVSETLTAGTIIANQDATISASLAGTSGLTKLGSGRLTLNATSSTLSGDVKIGAGELYGRFSALGSGNIVFTGDSTFTKIYNTPGSTTKSFTINDGVTGSIGGSTFYYNFATSGVLAGGTTATLQMNGGGNTEKNFNSTANTFTGTLYLNNGGIGSDTNQNGARVGFRSLADSTQKLRINNAHFRLNDGGVSMNFANRQLEILGNARIDNDSTNSGVTMTFAQDVLATIGNNTRTLYLSGVNTGDNIISGKISDSANGSGLVNVTKWETGKWILAGANDYTGTTTITRGTLEIGTGGQLGTGTVTNDASLIFNSSSDVSVGNTILGSGTITHTGTGKVTVTGDVSGFAGTITADGPMDVTGTLGGSTTVSDSFEIGSGVIGTMTLDEGDSGTSGDGASITLAGGTTWYVDIENTGSFDKIVGSNGLLETDSTLLLPASGIITIDVNILGSVSKDDSFILFDGNLGGAAFSPSIFNIIGDNQGFWTISEGSLILTSTIPEPSTALLAGLGLAGLSFRRRRNRR